MEWKDERRLEDHKNKEMEGSNWLPPQVNNGGLCAKSTVNIPVIFNGCYFFVVGVGRINTRQVRSSSPSQMVDPVFLFGNSIG